MKKLRIQKHTRTDFLTYLGVIAAFAVLSTLNASGGLSRSLSGQLVPICCYMSMAVSLNLTVGILGELSLGHAGFMSVGAFSGIIAAMSLQSAIPSEPIRLAIAMVVGALVAALAGVIVGTPVLRHPGRLPGHCHTGLWRNHQGAGQLSSGGPRLPGAAHRPQHHRQ